LSTLIRFVRLVLIFAFLGVAGAANSPRTVVVLGDSLSAGYGLKIQEGWVHLLEQRLAAQGYEYRVVNASVSGETTQGGVARLPRMIDLHKPAIVIVELGGNDGLRGLPLATSRENLKRAIDLARKANARVVLVGMVIPPNYGPRYGQQFRDMYADLAKQYQLPFVPFFLDKIALNPDLMQADGIHANAKGQPQMLENLWPQLKPLLVAPGKPAG